ncbi:hypothetical protein T4B_14970 [Trichinella pseudospiralis]|uniref:Uncharacterized protein n=1 Tax=Trichinella pseudospiralis TaxID=6337 RepID=A0A0V1GXT7_TRIPS|nr:hypothetical protein T4B_14970 [Trichinella pseudospiralis]
MFHSLKLSKKKLNSLLPYNGCSVFSLALLLIRMLLDSPLKLNMANIFLMFNDQNVSVTYLLYFIYMAFYAF